MSVVRQTTQSNREGDVMNPITTIHPDLFPEDVLLERVCRSSRDIVFFLGAPLTTPDAGNPGVPDVRGVLELVREELSDSIGAFASVDQLLASGDDGSAYRTAFTNLQAFRGQDAANRVIRRAVLQARLPGADDPGSLESATSMTSPFSETCRLIEAKPSGWHLRPSVEALGKLLAGYPRLFAPTVLTTNFDPLIETSVQRCGGRYLRTVLHGDGSLYVTEGSGVRVVHLHGYWTGSDTLHSPAQLGQFRPQLRHSLMRILENRTLLVLGCGGWDDVFLSSLADLVSDTEASPDILWAFYESDSDMIRTKYSSLLERLATGIGRSRVMLYGGIDLHQFLPRLLTRVQAESDDGEPEEVKALLERLIELSPDLRKYVTEKVNPALVTAVEDLQVRHEALERVHANIRTKSAEHVQKLEEERRGLKQQLKAARRALTMAQATLALAAMRDVTWLQKIRTTLMPPEPGRTPFHNSAEVALRGFHTSNTSQWEPKLVSITWSELPHKEKYHRGYHAGLIFKGSMFAPGVTYASRISGETTPPKGRNDYWFREANIYYGDYLEVATGNHGIEVPLGYRNTEFCVRNPNGKTSNWVKFSYSFDDVELIRLYNEFKKTGEDLIAAREYQEAIEPLRKARMFVQRLPSVASEFEEVQANWELARDMAVRARLRFSKGDIVFVREGTHAGKCVVVERIQTNQSKPYWVQMPSGELEAMGDDELEENCASS